jgi:hypothetical protein
LIRPGCPDGLAVDVQPIQADRDGHEGQEQPESGDQRGHLAEERHIAPAQDRVRREELLRPTRAEHAGLLEPGHVLDQERLPVLDPRAAERRLVAHRLVQLAQTVEVSRLRLRRTHRGPAIDIGAIIGAVEVRHLDLLGHVAQPGRQAGEG